MKFKKIIPVMLLSSSIIGTASCSNNVDNTSEKLLALNTSFYDEKNNFNTDESVMDYLLEAIKMSGKSMISSVISSLATQGFNFLLKEMGYDTRSIEEQKLDKISSQLEVLQNTVSEGIKKIQRQAVQIRNENLMNGILKELDEVRGPVSDSFVVLGDISKKELEGTDSKESLDRQKETLAKNISNYKFTTLTANDIWYSTTLLAKSIMVPSQAAPSITLWTLYDDTFGALESWEYMMIKPRKEFIGYLAFLVNGMAELSKIAANYQISLLPEGDSNIKGIENGINTMVDYVNSVNEKLQEQLVKLDEIKKRHDEEHIMVHRDREIDDNGNIVITEGVKLSTRLLPVSVGNSEYNYVGYTHNNGGDYYPGGSAQDPGYYKDYVYLLNSASQYETQETIFYEYRQYNSSLGNEDYTTFTIKDYLATIGFTSREKENFIKTEGFYLASTFIADYKGFLPPLDNTYSLNVLFDDFRTQSMSYVKYSSVKHHVSSMTDPGTYTKELDMAHWYLAFLDVDQETLMGDVEKVIVDKFTYKSDGGVIWTNLYKGKYNWTNDPENKARLIEEHR